MANSNHRFGAFEEAVPEFNFFFKKKNPITALALLRRRYLHFSPLSMANLFSFYGQFQSPLGTFENAVPEFSCVSNKNFNLRLGAFGAVRNPSILNPKP